MTNASSPPLVESPLVEAPLVEVTGVGKSFRNGTVALAGIDLAVALGALEKFRKVALSLRATK
jgi:hypothetical protein